MSVEPGGHAKAQCNDRETVALLDHLIENKAPGQGNGNFKDPVFTSAAEAISSLLSDGPVKTSKACKNKWTTVSIVIIFSYHHSLFIDQQLKSIESVFFTESVEYLLKE